MIRQNIGVCQENPTFATSTIWSDLGIRSRFNHYVHQSQHGASLVTRKCLKSRNQANFLGYWRVWEFGCHELPGMAFQGSGKPQEPIDG